MKTISCFISLLLLCLLLTGCKKYEDGPWLSLRSKEHRILGEWAVDYFSINGYDSTAYLKSQALYGTYSFEKPDHGYPGGFVYNCAGNRGADTSKYYSQEGKWEFSNDKKNIIITSNYDYPPWRHFNIGPYTALGVITWRIMRLEEKELWLKMTYTDGREYFIKFTLKAE